MIAQFGLANCVIRHPYIRDQPHQLLPVRYHHRFPHPLTGNQLAFDLAEFDPESAQFDLKIASSDVGDLSIRRPTPEIPCLI